MFKKKERKCLTLIDKDLVKEHCALTNIKHNNEKACGIKVFFLDKYEYMWSI